MKTSFVIIPAILGFIKITFLPNLNMLGWAFAAIGIDFVTGIMKSAVNKVALTSGGFRNTIKKVIQYAGAIVLFALLGNALPQDNDVVMYINNTLLAFIIYTEAYSTIENLRDMNPDSPISKKFFVPVLSLLTLGMDKLSLLKKQQQQDEEKNSSIRNPPGTYILIVIAAASIAITSCKVVRPGQTSSYEKTDTTTTKYKPVDVTVKGATVYNTVNIDSLFNAWKKNLAANDQQKADSLFKAILNSLSLKRDTVTVTDPKSKAQLKYWFDEFGKLQMSCESKEQTISLMVAEITRLTKEVSKKATIEIVYKMPWWGWVLVGVSTFCIAAFMVLIAVLYYKRG